MNPNLSAFLLCFYDRNELSCIYTISSNQSSSISYSVPLNKIMKSKQFHSLLNSKVSFFLRKDIKQNSFEKSTVLVFVFVFFSSLFCFKRRLALPFYLCQVVFASHFHFLQLLMLSCGNAAQRAQGSQVSVFPEGKLPVDSRLLKVTKGIHFIAKPKNIISWTPCT